MSAIETVLALMLAMAGPASTRPSFVSSVPGLPITATSVLPRGPGVALDDYCTDKAIDARSTAGRLVEARGWHVTAEQSVGRYMAVSFAGRFEPMTSGVCSTSDGNVALFEGDRIVAIVYRSGGEREAPRIVTPMGEPGRLRIWGDEYAWPLADLAVVDGGATVVPVAAVDRWCGGAVSVPNVYGATIQVARTRLLKAGWRPDPAPAADFAGRVFGHDLELRREGVVEVGSCSGTGYGLCAFNYRSAGGQSLQVITADDEPTVVDYGVECRPRR